MNRPRLPFVKQYFIDLSNQGNKEADELISEYNDIKETNGEFLAGRFIIEVYIETQKTLEESFNARTV
tara:strand:- start:862 stop:1065 length:204 start_codon:yes stop_codon:yes gene_type:complete